MTHFTEAELLQWRESGPGRDRALLLDHLRECASCAARYAEAIRTRPLKPSEAAGDVHDLIEAGYSVPTQRRVLTFPIARRHVLSLAAAAALVAAAAAPWLVRRGPDDTTLRFRGASIQSIAPEGSVDRDAAFVWTSGLDAARFRVEVGRIDSDVLFSTDTMAMRLAMPAAWREALSPGVTYWWTVSAIDAGGRELLRSPRRTFSIQPR